LAPKHWDVIEGLNTLFAPLVSFLEFLQAESSVVISRFLKMLQGVISKIERCDVDSSMTEFRTKLQQSIGVRFGSYLTEGNSHRFLCIMGALLHPLQIQTVPWRVEEETVCWEILKRIATELSPTEPPKSIQKTVDNPIKKEKLTFQDLFLESEPTQQDHPTVRDFSSQFEQERRIFVELPKIHFESNILDFWRSNQFKLPMLSRVARVILAVPMTDAAVERVWSSAGLTVTKRRNRLSEFRISQTVFVKKNRKFLPQVKPQASTMTTLPIQNTNVSSTLHIVPFSNSRNQ